MISKTGIVLCFALSVSVLQAQVTDPMITKWLFNTTNTTYNSNLVNVEAVYYSSSRVYVKSTGIPSYYTGLQSDGGNLANAIQAQTYVFVLPRTQTIPSSDASRTYLRDEGNVAVFINGIVAFSPCDGKSYNSGGVWHQLAYKFEAGDFDNYNGHNNVSGVYHNHVKPSQLYSSSTTAHSALIGYAFDGYPIYGPYGYSSALDATSSITRMKTSWQVRNITARTTLPDGSTASQTGPTIASAALGKYWEDYTYTAGSGDLDRYNMRYCKTPEYTSGTYAYFVTVDASGNPEFPYIIGDYFYGAPLMTNNGAFMLNSGTRVGSNTVPGTGVTQYSSTLPVELIEFSGKLENCNVLLNWRSGMESKFDYYDVEYSDDAQSFKSIGHVAAQGNGQSYPFKHEVSNVISYYRLKMVDKDGSFRYSKVVGIDTPCDLGQIGMDIFPNPFEGFLSVRFRDNDLYKVNIYNINGQIVQSVETSQQAQLDMSKQASGTYIVEIVNPRTQTGFMKRVVKR